MSASLENDRWSSGSVDYSFSINWDGSKWITIVNFTLWHDLRLKHCHPPYVLTVGRQFIVILTKKKTLLFKFPWLEFRFKSFLELHVHFKGFMYIRMRKLHAERQIPADAHDWCQIVFSFNVPKFIAKCWTTNQLSQFFGWSVRTLAQYILFFFTDQNQYKMTFKW